MLEVCMGLSYSSGYQAFSAISRIGFYAEYLIASRQSHMLFMSYPGAQFLVLVRCEHLELMPAQTLCATRLIN